MTLARDLRSKRDRLLRAQYGAPIPDKAPEGELGAPGTSVARSTGGSLIVLDPEYNPDLRGQLFYQQINRMRLSDSQVKAVTSMLKLPLLAADWRVEPPTDSDRDREIADWISLNFFERMSRTWQYTLRHALLSLDFGSMPMETVFDSTDDEDLGRPMIYLRKLAPRFPNTVVEWRVARDGGLESILQTVDIGGVSQNVDIEVNRLLCFVHDMEGANWRGTSILRQARKDWTIKERLQRINQVAIEKRAAGVDVGEMDETASQDTKNKDAYEAVLQSIRTHERSYVLLPKGHKYSIAGIEGQVLDPLPAIKYADIMILRSILADFLTAGTGDTGSFAMVRDRSSFFLMALLGVAKEITEPINRYLIPKLVKWNWPDVREFPHLNHSRLDRRDVKALSDALGVLIPNGVITPDNELENEVRDWLDLPRVDQQGPVENPNEPMPPVGPPAPGSEVLDDLLDEVRGPDTFRRIRNKAEWRERAYRVRGHLSDKVRARAKTSAERTVDWLLLARSTDSAQGQIVKAYADVQRRQIAKAVEEAMKAIKAGDADALEQVNIPFKQQAADAIVKPLIELYRVGQSEVKRELLKMGAEPLRLAAPLDPESDRATLAFLRARARMISSVLSERLRGSLMRNGMDMIRDGVTDPMVLQGKISSLSERAIRTEANLSVSEALNLGRESTAKRNETSIKEIQYSSLLDDTTCGPCSDLDGKQFQYGSDEYERNKPPYNGCDGRGRCRCVYVYTFASESPDRSVDMPPVASHDGITVKKDQLPSGVKRTTYVLDNVEGSNLDVVERPNGLRSVSSVYLPESARGKGYGQKMYHRALKDGDLLYKDPTSDSITPAARRAQQALIDKRLAKVKEVEDYKLLTLTPEGRSAKL